jgi:phosphoglycolate phosphatase-like HAD superfamily hydrolase
MIHRHLNHQNLTLAAIDDVIGRGKRQDWADLRRAALRDRVVLEKVLRVCQAHVDDPYAQRYHFWKHYAERHLA